MDEFRILAVVTGAYGRRHAGNIIEHGPPGWVVETWTAPVMLPPIVDYPEDYVPESLPAADLVVSFAEVAGVAELLPEVVRLTGAKAVLAAVDSEAWLPRGLARQLRGWLEEMGVECVTPKPLCSLTETHYGSGRGGKVPYEHPAISEFARYFGRPEFEITVADRVVTGVQVVRDAVCGCARHVAEGLVGVPVEEAGEKSGMLHHHYPCMASMGIDADYDDTLMHVSGNILKDAVAEQLKGHAPVRYWRPPT